MGDSRLIAKNTFLLTLGLVIGRILALLVIRKMTPLLGPSGMGIWAWATEVTAIVLVVTNFGLGTLVTREVARARGMTLSIWWAAVRVRWLVAAVCYLGLMAYVFLTGKSVLARDAMLVTALAVFVESTAMACDSVLQAHEKVWYQTISQLVSVVIYFGLAFWFLDAGYGVMGVVWANLISRVARLATVAPLMMIHTRPWRDDGLEGTLPVSMRWMISLGWPLFLSTFLGIVYFKIDIVMLTEMVGEAATGIYFLGHRPLDYMLILPNIFATAFFPTMARYGSAHKDVVRLGERALRYMLFIMLPLTMFVILLAEPIIHWFEGRSGPDTEFADSIKVLRIVMLAVPFQAANYVLNRLLISAGREKDFVIIAFIPLLANVFLNLFLIPRYSYFGAAFASVVSLLASYIMHWYFVRRTALRIPLGRTMIRNLLALAGGWFSAVALLQVLFPGWGAGWFNLPLNSGWGPFLAATGIVSVFYVLAALAFRVLQPGDLRLLRQIWHGTTEAD